MILLVYLCDHLSAHATTENVTSHKPDVPKKCTIVKTVAGFNDIPRQAMIDTEYLHHIYDVIYMDVNLHM